MASEIYTWWDQVPETLKTMTQLGKEGFKPGGPPRAQIVYGKGRRHREYDLYSTEEAIAKQPTAEQLAALEKARLVRRTCKRCGTVVELPSHLSKRGNCGACVDAIVAKKRQQEVDNVVAWARIMLADQEALILDTETTDLDGYLCEIALIRMDGSVVFDTLVNPQKPNEATQIHGITREMTQSAPTFADLEPELRRLLHGRTVVVYNSAFDSGVLDREIERLCTPTNEQRAWLTETDLVAVWPDRPQLYLKTLRDDWFDYWLLIREQAAWWVGRINWECAMLSYATYVGDWHDYYRNYRYQPLRGGHRALGDCHACLAVLKEMAT